MFFHMQTTRFEAFYACLLFERVSRKLTFRLGERFMWQVTLSTTGLAEPRTILFIFAYCSLCEQR